MNLPIALLQIWMLVMGISIISYMFKGNAFFTASMQMIIGLLAANYLVLAWGSLKNIVYSPVQAGNYIPILFLAISLLMFTTFSKKLRWLARYPTAILTGSGVGLALRSILYTDVISQVSSSILPVNLNNPIVSISNIIQIFALCLSLFYFMFGFELKSGWMQTATRIGRIIIMAGLGATIGGTIFGDSSIGLKVWAQFKNYIDTFLINIA